MNTHSNSRRVLALSTALLAGTFGLALTTAEAGAAIASTSCITGNVWNLDATHIKIVPYGCDAINSAPFSFSGVIDADGVSHDVTIDTLEEFAMTNGRGGAFVVGTVDGNAFVGLGNTQATPGLGHATLGVAFNFTIPEDSIYGGSLPPGFDLQIDPTKTSSGTELAIDLGNGTFSVTDNFNLFFQLSLDGGTTFVSTDPGFGLQQFDPTTNPLLESLLVPEPASLALFGIGLAGLGLIRRKRAE